MAEFQCLSCARCCRSLAVIVTRVDLVKWLNLGLYHVASCVFRAVRGWPSRILPETLYVLPSREDGGCVFLRDGRCLIYEFRPLTCILFPYAYSVSEDELRHHPWALKNCEAFRRGFTELKEDNRRMLLNVARTIFKELISVDENREDYERLINEAKSLASRSKSILKLERASE